MEIDKKQQERLRQFFKEETTWFPEHVGNNLMAVIFSFLSVVMMAIPIQAWERDDFLMIIYGYGMEWIGVSFYVQKFINYTENRQWKYMYGLLRYLPVSRRQLNIFIMKKVIKLCLCLMGVTVLFQGIFTVADGYTYTAVNILVPVFVCFAIPVGGLAFGMWCSKPRV